MIIIEHRNTKEVEGMLQKFQSFLKCLILWFIGGVFYFDIELLWRGFSHWTMFALGGICFVFAGVQSKRTMCPLWMQTLKVDAFSLIAEFMTGCIINLKLGWNIWDYSILPFNLLGQSCPQFALLFLPLCFGGIILNDQLRHLMFNEDKPQYLTSKQYIKELSH